MVLLEKNCLLSGIANYLFKKLFIVFIIAKIIINPLFADSVYDTGKPVQLNASMVKWFVASSHIPREHIHSNKIVLATASFQDLGDFSCILEVYNEILYRRPVGDDVDIQLQVIARKGQKELIYKTFQQAAELDIIWQYFDDRDGITQGENVADRDDVDLTLALSAYKANDISPVYPWLELWQFRSTPIIPEDLRQVVPHYYQVKRYFEKALENRHATVSMTHRDGGPELYEELERLNQILRNFPDASVVKDMLGTPPFICSLSKLFFCESAMQFGLNNAAGLPFNSRLRHKINEFEYSQNRFNTKLVADLIRFIRQKPWFAKAVTRQQQIKTQVEVFYTRPYFAAYHHELASLKEYLAIIGELQSYVVLVSSLKHEVVKSRAFLEMAAQLGYEQVEFVSEGLHKYHFPYIPTGNKTLKIVNPGRVSDEDAYNAMLYFAHPYIHVAGNISLVKAITMNKLPFYEWRYFHTHINPGLKVVWKGTGYEALFENEYNPETKALVIRQRGIDYAVLRDTGQKIFDNHNAMPALMDVVRLTYEPSHEIWQIARQLDYLIHEEAYDRAMTLVNSQIDPVYKEIMAARFLLAARSHNPEPVSGNRAGQLLRFISDIQIKTLLMEMLKIRLNAERL